jgi:drug/metabolite transporter (DMT)-like permease
VKGAIATDYAIPLITVLLWSGNTVVMRVAVGVIDPETIMAYRWVLAALALFPFVFRALWQHRAAIRQNIGKLAGLGLLGMVLYQGCAYYAAQTTTATNMGIIASLVPLITFGFSAILLGDRPGWTTAAGGLLSLVGLSVLIGQGQPLNILSGGFHLGDAIMLFGAICYALYSVMLRRWAVPVPVWPSLYIQILTAILVLVPLYLITPTLPVTMAAVPIILYSALPISILAPILWMLAVARLGANRSSIFMNLLPIFTAVIATFALGETLYTYHLIGGLLTLSGVLLAQMTRGRPR